MKKIFAAVLVISLICITLGIYFLDKEYFISPVGYSAGEVIVRNDSGGGGSFASHRNGHRKHGGLDLLADMYTPVLAARCGVVIAATSNNGMGKYVIIRHFDGMATLYGHLSRIYVTKTALVRQGQVIGAVGKTGNARGANILPHLHFEVRLSGITQDPTQYLI